MNKGLGGSLRILGALSLLSLATLAVLFVLGVVPREELANTARKIVALIGIGTVTLIGLGALFKSGD
jgi:hypothetical protein